MVVLADAVVDPGAVVVHLPDAPLAHRAVVRPLRLDAAALRALEYHLLRRHSMSKSEGPMYRVDNWFDFVLKYDNSTI